MNGRPNLILSPHLDDAVFSLGGLIAKEPTTTKIVTFCTGMPTPAVSKWWDRLCGFADSTTSQIARIAEDDAAFRILGVPTEQTIRLQYLESQYRTEETVEEIKEKWIGEIEDLCNSLSDYDVFAPVFEEHPDHALVKHALLAHAKRGNTSLRFYLYQDMPYGYFFLRRKSVFPVQWLNFSKISKHVNLPQEFIDINKPEHNRKMQAIFSYASQFPFPFSLLKSSVPSYPRAQAVYFKRSAPYVEVVYRLITSQEADPEGNFVYPYPVIGF